MTESDPTLTATRGVGAPVDLQKFAWLSIAAALGTIALKTYAWRLTGSVGLMSDAAESLVNLVAAVVALFALRLSISPADRGHNFGHSKAEYFSAAIEGLMIFVAAAFIVYKATLRLLHPEPLENIGVGLLLSVGASLINAGVALVLLRAATRYHSITLKADGKHLMTDVITSAGVLVGVGLVALLRVGWLDPVVAILVGLNIIYMGYKLIRESGHGLLDASLADEENVALAALLETFVVDGQVGFHGLRTRVAGRHRFGEVHLLVPGAWSVQLAHDRCEEVESAIHAQFRDMSFICHLEPIEDPKSYEDIPAAHIPVGRRPLSPSEPDPST